MRMSLKGRIVALTLLAAVAPVLVMLGLTLNLQSRVLALVEKELNDLAAQNIEQVARDVYGLCRTANDLIQNAVNRDLQVARDALRRAGRPALSPDTVEWEAINQLTRETVRVSLPRLAIGDQWLGQNRDPAAPTPIVDEVTRLAGGTCTIFQRMDEPRGMLRVATTVRDADGRRAIGTFIPETGPDGAPNPVVAAVLKGETYRGVAFVVNARYVTAYEPLRDTAGRVIGMLYVGEKIEAVQALRQSILDIRVGRSGYVSVLEGRGEHKGRYIISMKNPASPPGSAAGLRDGENPLHDPDPAVREVIRYFVENTVAAPEGEIVRGEYLWKNPDGTGLRNKVGAALYFAPWDWVIVATAYEDDYLAAHRHVREAIESLSRRLAGAGALILVLAALAAGMVGAVLVKPLGTVVALAGRIAAGDVSGARALLAGHPAARKGAREIRTLLEAFQTMAESLHGLIAQMQRAGIQVTASATQIAASARELEATAAEQAASSKEVNATSREIAGVSDKLLGAMETIGQGAADTARTAESGRAGLQRLEDAVRRLAQATASISAKLGVISDRAHTISGVVTTIARISDQTNLLALNAAIEAEKAGEYGKGFAVVARETSRLADQTAAATQDIEQMVKDMQGSVSSGVMEMDKFSEEVRRGGETVAAIGDQLGQVIDQVKALAPSFDSVKDGMRGQATSAQQISEAIHQLSVAAEQTRQALHEFNQAADQLNGAVQGLKTEVSRFNLN